MVKKVSLEAYSQESRHFSDERFKEKILLFKTELFLQELRNKDNSLSNISNTHLDELEELFNIFNKIKLYRKSEQNIYNNYIIAKKQGNKEKEKELFIQYNKVKFEKKELEKCFKALDNTI